MEDLDRRLVGLLLAAGSASRFGSDKLRHALPHGVPIAVKDVLADIVHDDDVVALLGAGNIGALHQQVPQSPFVAEDARVVT